MEYFEWYFIVILGTVCACICVILQGVLFKQEPVLWCVSVISGVLAYLFFRVARRLKYND